MDGYERSRDMGWTPCKTLTCYTRVHDGGFSGYCTVCSEKRRNPGKAYGPNGKEMGDTFWVGIDEKAEDPMKARDLLKGLSVSEAVGYIGRSFELMATIVEKLDSIEQLLQPPLVVREGYSCPKCATYLGSLQPCHCHECGYDGTVEEEVEVPGVIG